MGSQLSTLNQQSDGPGHSSNQIVELNSSEMDQATNENLSIEGSIDDSEVLSSNKEHNEYKNGIDESNCSLSNDSVKISSESTTEDIARVQSRQQKLEEFKEELNIKRELRSNAIAEMRNEISRLKTQLAESNEQFKQMNLERSENSCQNCTAICESLKLAGSNSESSDPNIALRSMLSDHHLSLQNANSEILSLSSELMATKNHANALKDIVAASKEIIEIRETELSLLKAKMKEIEKSLADREMQMMSDNLRQEYDRQLANIRNLRALYDERARVNAAEKDSLNRQLEDSRAELSSASDRHKTLEELNTSLDTDLKSMTTNFYATQEKLNYYMAENKELHAEMTVINQLFGQLLAGFNGNNNINIDKLTTMLEENRDLLHNITEKETCREGAAQISKLMFDLVLQTDDLHNVKLISEPEKPAMGYNETDSDNAKVASSQEIIHNLPKVWRVLTELLNHQQIQPVELENNQQELCYKSVQTPSGPQKVLSVSKTYIRLKDLIMEKKFLQKETKKLRNLNTHLESRINEQEQRLSSVTIELNKTWTLAGRMQRQHRQLHTQEQVLRYQLQQKRRMIGELKEDLEYCRRKWTLAKEKNNDTQSQWETLREEFKSRKDIDLNISSESGYSDSPVSEDEENCCTSIEKSRNSRTKKKLTEHIFLTTDRNPSRIHSVSPKRNAIEEVARRNSESHMTKHVTTDIQPVHTICAECGKSNIVPSETSNEQATDQAGTSSDGNNVQVNAASTSKTNICCERRSEVANSPSNETEEILDEIFSRLPTTNESQASTSENVTLNLEEREIARQARMQRLEEQCKLLMKQVTRASTRGDDLKARVEDIHNRCSFDQNTTESNQSTDASQPSTSESPENEISPETIIATDSNEQTEEETIDSHQDSSVTSNINENNENIENNESNDSDESIESNFNDVNEENF